MMRPHARLLLGLCAGLFFLPSAFAAQPSSADLPQRWVSAGGALTEWVVALGGESKLVGVDTTSLHPDSLKALPKIGYQRQLSAEGILSLRPNILVGTEEMGPPPVLSQLRTAGVQVEVLSAEPDLPTLKSNLQQLGKLLGSEDKASQLIASYDQQLDDQHRWVEQAQQHQSAPGVLLLVGNGGSKPMVAGVGTAGDWLIKQAGGRNLATHTGYKVFSVEAMAGLNPQVLVVADRELAGPAALQALPRCRPCSNRTRCWLRPRLAAKADCWIWTRPCWWVV